MRKDNTSVEVGTVMQVGGGGYFFLSTGGERNVYCHPKRGRPVHGHGKKNPSLSMLGAGEPLPIPSEGARIVFIRGEDGDRGPRAALWAHAKDWTAAGGELPEEVTGSLQPESAERHGYVPMTVGGGDYYHSVDKARDGYVPMTVGGGEYHRR